MLRHDAVAVAVAVAVDAVDAVAVDWDAAVAVAVAVDAAVADDCCCCLAADDWDAVEGRRQFMLVRRFESITIYRYAVLAFAVSLTLDFSTVSQLTAE
jgi:hypothetical protein